MKKLIRALDFQNLGNMKCNLEVLVCQFVKRRDMEAREKEAAKRPMDYLAENLSLPCKCECVREQDRSTGCLMQDFDDILKMHGPRVAEPFIKWYSKLNPASPGYRWSRKNST